MSHHPSLYQIYLRCSQLAIYRINSIPAPITFPPNRESLLLIQFTKMLSRHLESFEEAEQGTMLEIKRVQRRLVPFVTASKANATLSGLFFTGDRPHWIVGTDTSGVKLVPCSHSVVHSFTTCSVWDSKSDFLLYTDEVSKYNKLDDKRSLTFD
jgi:cleavage and polyadenylation specificity factor subunit 1